MNRRKFIGGISVVGSAALTAVASPNEARSVKYGVKGFTCVTCAVGLEVMLRRQKGVTRADASYPDENVVIAFDRALTSPSALKGFIAQCGFSVVDAE